VTHTNAAVPPSQLALDTEYLTWDPILYQWAMNRFGGILQIARHANTTDTTDKNINNNNANINTHNTQPATTTTTGTNAETTNTQNHQNQNNVNTIPTQLPHPQTPNRMPALNGQEFPLLDNQRYTTPNQPNGQNQLMHHDTNTQAATPYNLNRLSVQHHQTPTETIDLTTNGLAPNGIPGQSCIPHPQIHAHNPGHITPNSFAETNRFPDINCYPMLNSFQGQSCFPNTATIGNTPPWSPSTPKRQSPWMAM